MYIISLLLANIINLTILHYHTARKTFIANAVCNSIITPTLLIPLYLTYLSIMEIGDLVYHKLLWQGILIDLNLSSAVVKFKSGYKQLPQSLLQTSFQEIIKKKEVSKNYDEQYFDMHREDDLITNDML